MGVELIAEVASSHGGSIPLAKEFIKRFADAGANWIKFQSYQVKTLRPDDPQREWLAQAELSDDAHHDLIDECRANGVKFLTTVFHHSRVPFLKSLGLEAIKIGSGEATNVNLAHAIAKHEFTRAIVSCGLVDSPYRCALIGHSLRFDALHCVTRYPCPSHMADEEYRLFRGWSDHCVGLDGCRIAILKGAGIIEKHVTLHASGRFPVMRASRPFEATPSEFRELRQFADDDPSALKGRWQHDA